MLKYPENREFINDNLINSYSSFNKNGLNNPNSVLFIDESKRFPTIQEVTNLIHQNGGLCFLAHIYQYNIPDHTRFLYNLRKQIKIDGVEAKT